MYEQISEEEWDERFTKTTEEMLPNLPDGFDPQHVWSVIVSDDVWTIMAGVHVVNVVGFWITEEAHEFQYFVEDDISTDEEE